MTQSIACITVGDAYDNAMAESFFATQDCELIAQRKWETKTRARIEIFTWIKTWYNPRRRHSGLGQMSPINFEKLHQEKRQTAANPQTKSERLTGRTYVATIGFGLIGNADSEYRLISVGVIDRSGQIEQLPIVEIPSDPIQNTMYFPSEEYRQAKLERGKTMISIVEGDVLTSGADAVLLTIDGAKRGLEGNIARAYARRWPDAWMEIEDTIRYPVPLGRCVAVLPESESPSRLVLLASTLHHLDVMSDSQKAGIVRSTLGEAINLSFRHRTTHLATAVLTGGWRMEFGTALEAMMDALRPVAPPRHVQTVSIHALTHEHVHLAETVLGERLRLWSA